MTISRRAFSRTFVAVVLVLGFALDLAPSSATASDEVELARLINHSRVMASVPPVPVAAPLADAARAHAAQMAAQRTLFHTADLPATYGDHAPNWIRLSENVGTAGWAAHVHHLLMQSPTHRANILRPASSMGVGVVRTDDGELWAVEVFAYDGIAPTRCRTYRCRRG